MTRTPAPRRRLEGRFARCRGTNPRAVVGYGSWALLAACAGLTAGCKEGYEDEAFGVLELQTTYPENTPSDPTAGLPESIPVQTGYADGQQGEYYDFGSVPTIIRPATGEPASARVQPMYFFFTKSGAPLLARVQRETRNVTDQLVGGRDVREINPTDPCAADATIDPARCASLRAYEAGKPYGDRFRALLVDPQRGGADYQRPVVDVTPADVTSVRPLYTGLWEIVAVTVPDDYRPDAIKRYDTLKRGLDADDFSARPTGKVINCPIVDERITTPPGAVARAIPRPRMQVWYRGKLTLCFLVNGWETVGDEQGRPYPGTPDYDAVRVQTFDVAPIGLGTAASPSSSLVAPVSRAYVPAQQVDTLDGRSTPVRIAENIVARGRPRHTLADPPGYTPIRWMWDIFVPGPYRQGALRSPDALDESNSLPRSPLRTQNVALRGLSVPCSFPPNTKYNNTCQREVPNPNPNETGTVGSALGDPQCTALGLECDPDTCVCDLPFVGYGERCGSGVARCVPPTDYPLFRGTSCVAGFCYWGCDPTKPNNLRRTNEGLPLSEVRDSRCEGLPGYACLGGSKRGFCLKLCNENLNDQPAGATQCLASGTFDSAEVTLGAGQSCENLGLQVCVWPESYNGTGGAP